MTSSKSVSRSGLIERGQAIFEYAIMLGFLVVLGLFISSILESALEFTFLSALINRGTPPGIPATLGGEAGTPFSGIDPLNQPPVVAINTNPDPPIVMSGEDILFTSASYDPDEGDYISEVEWDIYGDGSVLKYGNQITHTFTTDQPSAIWQPRVTVTDNHGVKVSQLFSVAAYTTEVPNLPPVVQIQVEPLNGPAPLTVTFSSTSYDPDGTVDYHQWNFGETALTQNGTTEQYVYTTPGEYEAELLVTDNGGRQARSHRIFITVDEPEPPNQPPTLSVRAGDPTGVTGMPIDFITDAYSDPDGSVEYYEWDFGDGSPKIGPNIISGGVPIVPHTYLTAGAFNATMTITDNDGATASQSVSVSIIESSCSDPTIRRQIWNGITGSTLSNLTDLATYPYYPDGTESLTSLNLSANSGDNYGDRFIGYIIPPTSGAYVFYIASDDQSQLYLSVDESPDGKRLLSSVTSWTPYQDWTKQSNQKSAFVTLSAGQKYYFEVVHKEGGGGDHMSVGWIMPGDSYPPNVITQDHLCFDDILIPDNPPPIPTPTPQPTATPPPFTGGCNYQAENATLSGPSVKNSHSGYEGTGFADYPGSRGANVYIEWNVTVPSAGVYHTDFRYALGSGNRPLEFKVNGGVVSSALPFTSTGGWASWGTQEQLVYLNAGSNTIRLTALNNAGPNVDCLAVYE